MKLLQHSWSKLLVLDFIYQVHAIDPPLPKNIALVNGQMFNTYQLGLLGADSDPALLLQFSELLTRLAQLNFSRTDYACAKFFLLFAVGKKNSIIT